MSKLKIFHQEVFILIINPKFNVNIFASSTKSAIPFETKHYSFIYLFSNIFASMVTSKPCNVIPIESFTLVINYCNNIKNLSWGQNAILKISYFTWIDPWVSFIQIM
jgi:hypothetical protein